MDFNSPPPCPNTVTVRRNPHRKARDTPKYTPQSFNMREIPPFPNDDVLSAAQTPEVPSTSLQKPENENLKVFLRIRPLPVQSPNPAPRVRAKSVWPQNPAKKNNTAAGVPKTSKKKKKSSDTCILVNDSQSVTLSPPLDLQESKRIKSETYGGFSHVFSSGSSQFEVYETMVKPMVEEFLKGRSGMLAALGPSGSGKTHTVFGSPRDPGMVPLALRHIFKETESEAKQPSRSFYISIFEIYTERGKSEKLFDLLPDGGELSMQQSTIKGLQEVLISNAEQAESLIAQAVVKRATAMTKTNSQSSRSQCIINVRDVPQICTGVVNPKSDSAVLTIIDLAGAEREKRTGNQGTRLLESNFINNTLMVFGLCLRSLLEHQKNPKKPLQKHFQNSMLTRYMRDYLVGKKRMTLILTAKSGDEDYLDTSYLLRQASPYMQIKYNEDESSKMAAKKRQHQASSTGNYAKPSPALEVEHRKKMKLDIGEHTVENDGTKIEEQNGSEEDASTVCKLDASSSVSFKSECDSQAQSERNHIIMRNFAKVLWNVLKQYNYKLKVAEKEIQSLKESIGNEKKKYHVLETELNEFKACCTCCKRGKESSEARFDRSGEEPILGTSCTRLDSEKSDREVLVSSSKPAYHNALEVEPVSKIPSELSKPRPDQSDEEPTLRTSFTRLHFEKSDREVWGSSSKLGHHNSLEGEAVGKLPSELFCAPASSVSRLDQRDEEPTFGTSCTQSDSEKSEREVEVPLSNLWHHNAVEVEAVSKIPSETRYAQEPSEPKIDQSNGEPTLVTSCTQLDSEKPGRIDESNGEPMHDTSCIQLDSEKSDREVQASLSKPGHHHALEAQAVIKIPSGLLVSSSLIKGDLLDSSSPKNVSSTTCDLVGDPRGEIGVINCCKPPRPKRTLMPSSSMLSRDFTFDLVDESEKLKGTRKLAAGDQKRSNGSISLLRLLQGRGNHVQHSH